MKLATRQPRQIVSRQTKNWKLSVHIGSQRMFHNKKKWMIQIYSKCHLSPRARLAWKKKVQTKAPIRHSQTRVRRNQRMDSGQICLEAINADFILCFWTSLWLTVTSMYLIYHSKYLQIHILSLKNCSNLNGSFSEVPTGAAWLGKGFGRGLEPMLVSSLTSLILFNPISNNFCPIIFKVLKLNVRGGQKISQESDTSILVKFQRASTYPFRVRSRELGFARVSRCWSALRWRFWLTPPQETGKTCTNRYVALCVCVGMMSAHKYCTYKDTYTYVTYVYIYIHAYYIITDPYPWPTTTKCLQTGGTCQTDTSDVSYVPWTTCAERGLHFQIPFFLEGISFPKCPPMGTRTSRLLVNR